MTSPSALSRRSVLRAGAALGLAGLAGTAAGGVRSAAAQEAAENCTGPRGAFRIDVHCHHIPDFYRVAAARNGVVTAGGIPLPPWTPDLAVEFMESYGIQTQLVSISEPGVAFMPTPADRVALAQQVNDYTAKELVGSTNPLLAGRFGSFAVLPMRDGSPADITNAIAESVRAIETLGMDGVGILSNYAGAYLGDPRFDPLMATLDALGAVVFLHPVTPAAFPNLGLPTFLYEFVFDTTRAVVNLLYKQVLTRYPNIKWVIAHAGGTIPFLSYRTSLLSTQNPVVGQNVGIGPDDVVKEYAKLYYDTALSPTPAAQQSVRAVTSLEHVLFATDYPFAGPVFLVPGDPAPQLSETYTAAERLKVERDNALTLFPALAARLDCAPAAGGSRCSS